MLVVQRILGIVKIFQPHVGDVRIVHRMRPAQVFVVSDRGQWSAKEARAREIQTLAALKMPFIKLSVAEPGLVRVGEQHGLLRFGAAGTDDPYVGADRGLNILDRFAHLAARSVRFAEHEFQQHVTLESQHVPGLEVRDQPRLHLRIAGQVVVQSIGVGLTDGLQVRLDLGKVGLGMLRDLERAVQQVAVQAGFAVHLRIATETGNVGVFDLPEIVLSLRIGKAEHYGDVGGTLDVRHAPLVAMNGDLGSELVGRVVGAPVASDGETRGEQQPSQSISGMSRAAATHGSHSFERTEVRRWLATIEEEIAGGCGRMAACDSCPRIRPDRPSLP